MEFFDWLIKFHLQIIKIARGYRPFGRPIDHFIKTQIFINYINFLLTRDQTKPFFLMIQKKSYSTFNSLPQFRYVEMKKK